MDRGYAFILGALAVWRISYALTEEQGPARLLARLRAAVARWTAVLDCFYCASVWIALPVSLAIATTPGERALTWLALSGAACLFHRWTERREPPALYWEEPEDDNVLRQRASGTRTAAGTR